MLDRESRPEYNLTVRVADGYLNNITRVEIRIDDVNDNSPVFQASIIHIDVQEGLNTSVPVSIYNVTATDADEGENGFVTYFTNDTGKRG